MTVYRRLITRLALSASILAGTLVAAQAQDAAAVAERMKQFLSKQAMEISWSGIEGGGEAFTLEGVKFKATGETTPVELGKVSFEGVSEQDGTYRVETITTEAYSTTEDGAKIEVSPLVLSGVNLPAEGQSDPVADLMFYEGLELASLKVSMADRQVFSLENLTVEIPTPEDGQPMEFSGSAEKFTADLSLAEDPQAKAAIEALGLQTLTGSVEMTGSWNPADGRMGLSQYDLSVDNAGTFGMTFDLGGYTRDFIKAMQDMQKQMAEQPAGADDSAQGLAMLGLMQQLTFHSASLRWDDDTLTDKIIEYVAKSQNMKPEDIKNQAKAIMPFLTAQLNNPELSGQITSAVNAYLDNPQSLEISASPSTPVPFAQIMAAGMSDPMDLTKSLGVTVKANQAGAE
ncbi:hypothetical protein KEU06_11545 [Pseudaminobacter sp. 19-2017]|uniref:DUF945 domain-containing protein n=1 Tax=Pseudaminobacter soli (ex Zhang et al. 2022) TaxID=2831468 RepID=A0A942DXM2_9HYPH|nr:hypothetical protein [Pseudaminobacter soli]MBS3649243.1 hypothetical protein [Pseudaminobacter soli]